MTHPLLTDLYQLTMAQAYLRTGKGADRAVFHVFFRRLPFQGGFAIAAGLEPALQLLEQFRFSEADLAYLTSLRTAAGSPLFGPDFIGALRTLQLDVEVAAMPEGSVVFGNEPLLRVTGVLWHAQLLETALLNIINYQTLVATKAARIVSAARGRDVIEMGARRAQGEAALSASRAAYLGGCVATSHVLAGQTHGIPVRGTHAHSWVMSFDDELEAFAAYAQVSPDNCILLVDTYDTLTGVKHAIQVGEQLRQRGGKLRGVRLDSGDLAWLSIEARKLLDAAGFQDTQIVASNDLDEHLIESLIQQGAAIDVWGVGTKLVTAYDEPALGGVYKLAMLQSSAPGSSFVPRIKLSQQAAKLSNPGVQQVRRFSTGNRWVADVIFDETHGPGSPTVMIDPVDTTRQRTLSSKLTFEDVLVPVWRGGKRIGSAPTLEESRERARAQLEKLDPTVRRLLNPHEYPVGLCRDLYEQRMRLVQAARASTSSRGSVPPEA